jgi:hypothetical protein
MVCQSLTHDLYTLLFSQMESGEYLDIPVTLTVLGATASALIWSSLYFVFCFVNPSCNTEWHCREVTALHAITVVALSGWSAFLQGPWPLSDPGQFSYFLLLLHAILMINESL